MSPERRRHRRSSRSGFFAVAAVAFVVSGQVRAGDDPATASTSEGFWGSVMDTLNLRTKVGPVPDFVQKTRPDPSTLHFIPTSQPHPKRSVPIKSADDVEAAKQALDAAREAQLNPPPPTPNPAPVLLPSSRAAKRPAKPTPAADQN